MTAQNNVEKPKTFADLLRSELAKLDEQICEPQWHSANPGDLCPKCRQGTLELDGTLNLVCTQCDYLIAGVCT